MLEGFMFVATGWLLAGMSSAGDNPQIAADELLLKNAGLTTDGDSLLAFFKKRTLPDSEREKVVQFIRQLGSESYRSREQAAAELIGRGPVVIELLREAAKDNDLEIAKRAEKCLARIQEKDVAVDVPAAAARLMGARKPAGAVETMLAYLPFADNDSVADEVRHVLATLAVTDGKAHPILVAGLTDKMALRRAAAGEALGNAGAGDQKTSVRKLLADPNPFVRLRVAMALVHAKDKDAVPVLIDALPSLSLHQAWQAEDILYRIADGKAPPTVSLGTDEAGRKKCRDAWQAWWKEHNATADLAKLGATQRLLGHTLVVLLDIGRVMELGPDNQPRWQVDGLMFPLDAQFVPGDPQSGDRLLVAEYHAGRVTERNLKGEIVWEKKIGGPLVAQRLPNGNTFIATDGGVLEVDRADKEIFSFTAPAGERIMKAIKLPNGEVACLTDAARIIRFDTAGKELHSYGITLGMKLFGGRIHMLPSGRVLIPHNQENKVVEYDARGKAVWEVAIDQPVAAVRLPNGNTLVTTMSPQRGAVEFDRAGHEVWSYRSTTRVTRAIRR